MNIGTGSWIHYTSGGSAPNRYFVIEWHDVKDAYSGNQYSFEGILQENGNIIFQYQTMTYNGGYECGASGIEDSTGLDGLSYVGFCNQASSNTAVLFTRPAPAVRISVHPTDQGHFTVAGGLESFSLPIRNTGDLGADTFDITLNSTWSASLYASDGSTLLINTDTDGTVDTGPVSQGNTATVIVKVQTPGTAVLGDSNIGMLTIRSKIDTGVSKTITLKTAIPAPFVQAFEDNSDGAMHMNLVQPHGQTAEKVTGDYYWGNNDAIARASGDNYIYAWSRYGYSNNRDHYNIEYTLLDHAGNTLKPTIKLSNNSSATYDTQPAVAVTPDGHIGIVWTRKSYNNNYSQFIYNVFFAILDGTGKVVLSPTNITNNSAWGIWSSLNVPTYARPQISATGDNRFFLAWESDYNVSTGAINDVDFAVRNSLGGQILAAAPFVSGNPNGGPNFIEPSLTSLSSDRVFLSWESRQNGNDGDYLLGPLETCDSGPSGPTDLAGKTLAPGVYCYSSSVQISNW